MTHSAALDDLLAHASWARSLARRLVEDQAAADDVVQDLWVAALRRPPATDRPLRPWIAGVVRKLAGRHRRTAARRHEREQVAARPEQCAPADEPVARAEAQRMLVDEVLSLDEPFRTTVLQRYFDGLEPAEIAARTGVPAGTVRWRLSAARETLRERLDADHGGDSRSWAQALIPLAAFGAPQRAVLLTPILGGLLTMKMFWNSAALLMVALFAWIGIDVMRAPQAAPEGVGSATATTARATQDPADDTPGTPETPDRLALETGSAATPRNELDPGLFRTEARVRLRAVDPAGLPIAGAQVRPHYGPVGREPLAVTGPEGLAEIKLTGHPNNLDSATLQLVGPGRAQTTVSTNLVPRQTVDVGDVVLEDGTTIRGVVVDERGQPVADAEVEAVGRRRRIPVGRGLFADGEDGSGQVTTRSGPSGRFVLEGVLAARQRITAELGQDHAELWLKGEAEVDASAPGSADELRIVLTEPEGAADAIRVRVVDPDGRPVPYASVRLKSKRGMSSSTADRDGGKLFRSEVAGPFVLIAQHPDDAFLPARVEGVQKGARVELRFAPAQTATARLDFARRTPPAEVRLAFQSPPVGMLAGLFGGMPEDLGSDTVAVDPDTGTVRFRVPDRPFVIEVHAAGHLPAASGTLVPDSLPDPVVIALEPARQVRGRILDAAGAPLAGAEVDLHLRSQQQTTVNGFPVWIDRSAASSTRTDEAGAFTLDWQADRIARVRVVSADGALRGESEDLHPQTGDQRLDLVARPGGALEGRLLGIAQPAGVVVACSRGDGFARSVRADARGRYRFDDLLPGDYQVVLRDDEIDPNGWSSNSGMGSPHQEVPTDCRVTADATTLFDLRDDALGQAWVQVRIAVPGRALAGVEVEIVDAAAASGASPRSQGRGSLDAAGTALLRGLAPGRHQVRIQHSGMLLRGTIDLLDGKNEYVVDVTDTGSVRLTGLPPKPDRQFGGGVVLVSCELPNALLHFPVLEGGEILLENLPAGPARLERTPTEQEVRAALLSGQEDPLETLTVRQRFSIPSDGETTVAW